MWILRLSSLEMHHLGLQASHKKCHASSLDITFFFFLTPHTHFGIFGGAMTLKMGKIIKTSVLKSFDSNWENVNNI